MNKAIIFNCHYNGLSIIQDLSKHNITCVAMDHKRSIGTYSKYVKYIKCPNPEFEEKEFIDFLYDFCKKEKEKPVLFPTNDHWAMAISKYKNKLLKVSYPCVCDYKTIKLLLNKDYFCEFGLKKYLTPKIYNYKKIITNNNINFPIIIKPKTRRFSSQNKLNINFNELDVLRFVKINNYKELITFVNKHKNRLKLLSFQEYIPGKSNNMYTIGIYAKKGSILNIFTGHKIRGFPAQYGDCIYGESYNLPKYVINNSYKIIKDLNYTGIAELEYKFNTFKKKYRLIEINPRSWSWIGITTLMPISIPYYAYLDLIGIKQKRMKFTFKNGEIRYIKIITDFINCLFRYKKDHPKWQKSFFKWVKEICKINLKKTVVAEFNNKDYKIGLAIILKKISKK